MSKDATVPPRMARLTIDISREFHARLKMVAARNKTTLRKYSLEALEEKIAEEPTEYLSAEDAPILEELWNNPEDSVYDNL